MWVFLKNIFDMGEFQDFDAKRFGGGDAFGCQFLVWLYLVMNFCL